MEKLKPLLFCNEKIHQVLKLTEDVEKNNDPDICKVIILI